MPAVEIRNGATLEETVAKLKKDLTWLLENLDHFNVKRLYTEYCAIQSENGETVISGPVLTMYDKQATPVLRLKMGYDSVTDDFVFEMYDASGKKSVYLDAGGTEVLDGRFLLTYLGNTLLEAFKDTNGGKIAIYDINGNTNVRIGSEGTGGANVGGVIVLFNDSATKPRVAMGINAATDSGAIEALDTNGTIRTYMSGAQSGGEAGFIVYDSAGNAKSDIFETSGHINNEKIVTEDSPTFTTKITTPQIAFPAVQSASADANTLDDYEEGTWIPDLQFGGAKVGITYDGATGGSYTKIGNRVIGDCYIKLTSKGSSAGSATIAGLPFPGGLGGATLYISGITYANVFEAYLNGSTIYLQEVTEAGSVTDLTNADFANTSQLVITFMYHV